ncbi:MAG: AAA family ATPase [Verrucomicrobiota bacterium]
MLANNSTPRIYIAATHQDVGKTTSCIGLVSSLKKRYPKIGYTKPVGQRFVEFDGHKVDEDSVLIGQTYQVELPLDAMSPITIGPDFTRKYLSGEVESNMVHIVQEAFNRVAWEHDFVVIEGTGHAGVGSVLDLSNARVASALNSKVIIVSQGGIGRPVDEVALNAALFHKQGVEVAGVIVNKVLPEKIDKLRPLLHKAFDSMGFPLLGLIPLNSELPKPTLNQVCDVLKGTFVAGEQMRGRWVDRVVIGAASSRNADIYFHQGALIITAGDREDLILTIMEACDDNPELNISGVVLTQGFLPQAGLLKIMKSRPVPFISVPYDSYTAASRINSMTVKTELGNQTKIHLIQEMFENNVDVEAIIQTAKMPESVNKSF